MMLVSRLKTEVSKLRENKFGRRALNSFQNVSQELNNIKIETDVSQTIDEPAEKTKNRELEKNLSQQRNIFGEFQHIEADLKKILTSKREEINKLHFGIEQRIREEKEIESTILSLAEEIEKIEKLADETEKKLTKGEEEFNTKCVEQAIEYGSGKIFKICEMAEKPSKISVMVTIENILEESDQDQSESGKKKFSEIDLQQQFEENQELVIELGLRFNELLFELGRECVDKERYTQMEKELVEINQLIKEVQELAKELAMAIEKEKDVVEFEILEQKHLPQTIESLKELGQELQIMGLALDDKQATEREILILTQELKSNSREMRQKSQETVKRLDHNMQDLEKIGHEIEAEAERLEYEKQQIGKLNRAEEKQLEKLVEKGKKSEERLKTVSDKVLHSNKITIGPDNDEKREKFNDSANKNLEMELSIGLDQVRSVLGLLISEAEKLQEIKHREEKINLEINRRNLEIDKPSQVLQ